MADVKDYLMKVTDTVFSLLPTSMPTREQIERVKIVAHRGAHSKDIKENTLEAFRLCAEHGIWGVELDIRWTKDLVPVVHHDENTKRVFHKDMNLSEVNFSDLRRSVPEIPTLKELITELGTSVHYMIEVKEDKTLQSKSFQEKQEQFNIMMETLSNLVPGQNFHIMSLSPSLFSYIKGVPKECFLTIADLNEKKMVELTIDQGLGGYTGHYLTTTSGLRNQLKINSKSVGIGFVDSFALLKREIKKDVTWVFTNKPTYISQCRDQLLSVFSQ